MMLRRIVSYGLIILVALFVLVQLVPYGRAHNNPPVVQEPTWTSAETRELAVAACFDCHSNETVWPWYSHVAPVSWLVQHDVEEGREYLNFSDWRGGTREGEEAEELAEVILEGEMPPAVFLITHPEARLTDAQKQALVAGLRATAEGNNTSTAGHADDEHDDD